MSNHEPMGLMSFNYCQVQLPLAKAHAIQAILAGLDVVEVDTLYANGQTAKAAKRHTVPDVGGLRADTDYDYDAQKLNDEQYSQWKRLVTASNADEGFDLKACMPPECWLSIKGEPK